jgi:protein required for attachment to host cells
MDALTHARNHAPRHSFGPVPAPRGSDAPASDEWVLVAGATRGCLYLRSATGGPLTLRQVLRASPSPIRPSELRAHAAAQNAARVIAGARNVTPVSPQRKRHLQFASVLADVLEHGLATGQCSRITLVAACPFLGALRRSLSTGARRAAMTVIDQDLCDLAPGALQLALCGELRQAA